MAKKTKKTDPKAVARREKARKKAKLKRLMLTIAVCVFVGLAIAGYLIFSSMREAATDTFSDGTQTIRLRPNGRFTAQLYHGMSFNGEYTIGEEEGWTIVSFTHDGMTVQSEIVEDMLFIPTEWHDQCGHNTVLPRR